jgi:diadenosine tetraphosphatase ApaH/serine/threonine PP2A family protein phosphatase
LNLRQAGYLVKSAFIADVHGNLEAFTAVCASIRDECADRVVFLGDIVGYGANPNECIDLLRGLTEHCIAGNHDWAATGRQSTESFNPAARDAIGWTSAQLTPQNKKMLNALPLSLEMDGFLCVHATPCMPEQWRYILNVFDAQVIFETYHDRLCFVGHTHCPAVFKEQKNETVVKEAPPVVALQPQCRYIINSGSVGQPRDGDPRASYGVYDDSSSTYKLMRVEYDFFSAQKKILNAGLSDFLAHRISVGR